MGILKKAIYNVYTQKKQSLGVFILIAVFSFFVTASSVVIQSVKDGLVSTQQRLGADIMVVPEGYEGDLEGVLLCSNPCSIYFTHDITKQLMRIKGIEKSSSQIYIASLSASCCSVQVQIVAFEPDKDFVVKPWISSEIEGTSLGYGEAVIGYLVEAQPGDNIILYGTPLRVKARMAQTGNGFDACVFVTMDTANLIIQNSHESSVQDLKTENISASCYMVKAEDKSKIGGICREIESKIDGVTAIATQDFFGTIYISIDIINIFMVLILVLLWLVMFAILFISLYISLNNRKKEFGLYQMLGYSKSMLYRQLILEQLFLAVAGGGTGVFTALLIVYSFRNLIAVAVGLPYGSLTILHIISIILSGAGLSIITCIVIALLMCRKLGKCDIAGLLKEDI